MIDLKELGKQLELEDPLDELDELDLDDGDFIAMEFLDQVARVKPDTLTRRDSRKLKGLLREHPAVRNVLDDWVIDRDDAAAGMALGALAEDWGITSLDSSRNVSSVSLEAVQDLLGQCSWPGCSLPRKERQGSRGRHPKHCPDHTVERKRKDDRERIAAKRAGVLVLPECCKDWVKSGHRGKCGQHRQSEAASRPPYPLSAIEAAYLGAGGFHLV